MKRLESSTVRCSVNKYTRLKFYLFQVFTQLGHKIQLWADWFEYDIRESPENESGINSLVIAHVFERRPQFP
jgi:hypothetical protein